MVAQGRRGPRCRNTHRIEDLRGLESRLVGLPPFDDAGGAVYGGLLVADNVDGGWSRPFALGLAVEIGGEKNKCGAK